MEDRGTDLEPVTSRSHVHLKKLNRSSVHILCWIVLSQRLLQICCQSHAIFSYGKLFAALHFLASGSFASSTKTSIYGFKLYFSFTNTSLSQILPSDSQQLIQNPHFNMVIRTTFAPICTGNLNRSPCDRDLSRSDPGIYCHCFKLLVQRLETRITEKICRKSTVDKKSRRDQKTVLFFKTFL